MKKLFVSALPVCLLAMLLAGCGEERTAPRILLDRAATALENKDSQKFLDCLDLNAYAANQMKNMARNDEVLNSLNKLGRTLGLGNMDQLVGSLMDMEGTIRKELNMGVASGQIMADCERATTPDCPWWPAALKNAKLIELGPNAAIASVTTPANITSWLVLRKNGENWRIAGRAVLEGTAREYAAENAPAAPTGEQN